SSVFLLSWLERCMSAMQSGTQMVKLKAGSKGLVRLFYLDEHRSCIRWRPSRKSEKAKITIDSLYKVTEGRQSDIFHRHAENSFDPACCFTVYHGNHMESLDLVTSNPEEARTWVTGLQYLMAGISDEDSLAKRQRTHDQYPFKTNTWMKQTFEEADKNGDGLLNMEEIYQLLHKMNVNLPRRKVKHMFQEADSDDQQGTLTFEEFSVFYKMMSLRRDLYLLLMGYSDRKDHLTADELANFLLNEQKMVNVTTEYCLDVIEKFELSEENKQKGILGIEGFTSFMRSPTCDVFNPEHHEVNQDMDQPLSSYYISSSHNTYLTGDQLLSHSKTDMYAWVLQAGCRCVEVDCWDGPDGEPMVQHGYTLTSKITFKSVIETIDKYAFISNQYPVILSIENHCSIQQQKKIAQHLREILGDKLDLGEALRRDSIQLPSPHSLQGKILIKGKRLPPYLSVDVEEGEVSDDDDSADEIDDNFKLKNSNSNGNHQVESYIRKKLDSLLKEAQIGDKEDTDSSSIRALLRATHVGLQKNLPRHSKSRLKSQSTDGEEEGQETSGKEAGGQITRGGRKRKTMKLSRDLSDLVVFTNSVASQEGLDDSTPGNVLSFSETRAQQLVNHRAERFLCFNQRQLSRIYPSAYRIDSSNFNPQLYWNVGCQLVALNYQTEGRMMQLNRAKFMVNGGCGYALKPPPMCKGSFNPFSDDPLPAYPKKQLVLKIISGQQLPKPPDSMLGDRGEIIDPFVEVEIIGLPVDCCKEQTRVVDDNGFNPVWEENLSFTLHMAEVALVRFLVWDHDPIGRDFVGQRTVAFNSLMPGYRHVYLEGLTEASIFIHVSVHDIYGKGRQLGGIRGLFNRPSKFSVDTSCGSALRKRSISDHLLRRTASAPANHGKASISDRKDRVWRRPTPLTHRPISMPLEGLLQGQLSLCSPDQEQTDLGADTHIGGRNQRKKPTDSVTASCCLFLSAIHDHRLTCKGRATDFTESNCLHVPSESRPETTLLSTTNTATSSSPSSELSISLLNVDRSDLQSPVHLQDSIISHLIDAVSLGNDTTNGSISALIGQFDLTGDQNDFTMNSDPHTLSVMSCLSDPAVWDSSTPDKVTIDYTTRYKDPHTISSPRKAMNGPITPQKAMGEWGLSWGYTCLSNNSTVSDQFLLCHDTEGSSLMEVEINVDEDPLEMTLTLPRHNHTWVATSPTKCYAAPQLQHSQCSSPVKQPSHQPSPRQAPLTTPQTQPSSYTQLQPLTQTQPQSDTQPKPQTQLQPQSGRPSLPLLGSTLTPPLPILRPSTAPSPCKSKSLGDLTSEDISCNFHSKYNIISRSFITPCMRERRRMRGLGGLSQRLQSADPLTEQLRKLVTLEGDDRDGDRPQDSPPLLSRRLSSRSQSRVRHINNRARERQREALKPRDMSAPSSVGGVVLRTKVAACQNPPANRHSTGSYIAGYLDQLEERGLPEGGCTTLGYGYGDHYHDDSLLPTDSCIQSEPEVYFLLRL
uniref:Phosphoinositide phospholipase C n=1 Tax=Oncorhynchus mykiss TaxID=8022 RepID=A0A8K9X5A9_ONCMY